MIFMHALDIYAIMHFQNDIYAKTPKKKDNNIRHSGCFSYAFFNHYLYTKDNKVK